LTAILALLAGLAAFTALIAWQGVDTVAATFGLAGWNPLWLPVYYLLTLVLATQSWRCFFSLRPPLGTSLHAMWIGLAVNWMLPVAQLGGELVRARIFARSGMRGREAYASVIVDKTGQALTQLAYAVVGALMFLSLHTGEAVAVAVSAFVLTVGAGLIAFYRIQQAGLFTLVVKVGAKLVGRIDWTRAVEGAGNVDDAVRRIYSRRAHFWEGMAWRFAARVVAAGEVWLAFQFLGHPIGIFDAIIVESIGQAVRAAAFVVPAALGVQEGGYMLLAAGIGLTPELGLALSLCKRVRELVIGVGGLLAWKLWEGRNLLRARRAGEGR
jgi:putative membrane protein